MQFQWTKREKRLTLFFFFALFLLASLYFYDKANRTPPSSPASKFVVKEEVSSKSLVKKDQPEDEKEQSREKDTTVIAVDIKGAVEHPGVYTLKNGARIQEVIQLAGGLLSEADNRLINQAKVIHDGDMLYIPKQGEAPTLQNTVAKLVNSGESDVDKLIPINSATESQLSELPGIGAVKAKAILAYRTSHGPFKTKEEIKKVNGIGEKLYERIKEHFSLD